MHVFQAVLLCCLSLSLLPLVQVGLVSASSPGLSFDPSKPYALVVGDSGHIFLFDGQQLFQVPTNITADLGLVRWRHDGAYALAVGENNTLLKITVLSDRTVSVQRIATPLSNSTTLESVSWKADDSSALITGPWGKFLVFDGQKTSVVSSPISNRTIYGSAWSPRTDVAIVAGQNATIAEFNGTSTHLLYSATPNCINTKCSLFAVGWNPSGSYALVGGDNATLSEYQQGIVTDLSSEADVLFEKAPHLIHSITFNTDNGIGLIAGRLGLTVIVTPTSCDYSIFPGAVCLSYKRIQTYTALNGTTGIDLHKIGHFYDAEWLPGTGDAFAVGPTAQCHPGYTNCGDRGWTVARITRSGVTLVSEDRNAYFSLRSIDWQPTVRAPNSAMVTWYLIGSGSIGFASIIVVVKRKTLKEWLGHSPQDRTDFPVDSMAPSPMREEIDPESSK